MRTRRLVLGLAALVSAGLLACVLLADEPEPGRRYALVVGVQDYKDTGLGSLRYCDNDAAGLADVLTQRGYRVTLMTRPAWKAGDRDDLLPTADNIRVNLQAVLRNRKPADTVLLAFAGHGEQLKKDGKMYFCAAKCDLDDPKTLIALDEVYALLKDNAAGGKVLIVDACRNDPLAGRTVGSEKLESVTRPELPDPPGGTVALFSCSKGQTAYESDALKHGYLFHFVIEGLQGKAAGKGGRIKWTDLTKHVDDELSDAVTQELGARAVQTPEVRGESHGLVLAQVDAGSGPDRKALIADLRTKATTLSYRKAQLALSKLDLERVEKLSAAQAVSKQELDQCRQALKTDQAAVEAALQAVYAVRTRLGLPAQPDKGDDLAAVPPEWEPNVAGPEKTEEFEYKINGETKKDTRRVLTLDLGDGVTMEMVRIPHGTFMMGSPDSDKDAESDEKPQHEVTITRDFYLGKYLVTKKQFARFVAAQGASYKTEGEDGDGGWGFDGKDFKQDKMYSWRDPGFAQTDDHPVVNVTWNDAQAFCEWAGKVTKQGFTLPREAEWEYACRGGTTTRYFTGDADATLEGSANIADQSAKKLFSRWAVAGFDDGYVFTSPVTHFRPNPFGLYDMTGNAWEWCSDYYDPKYYKISDKEDPENRNKSDARVARGGCWMNLPRNCRGACRYYNAPAARSGVVGFRVAFRLD